MFMENKTVCGICGGDKWIQNNEYPLVRKCANPNCNGLHPHDVAKLRDIEGQVYDANENIMTDFDELEKRVK